MIENFLDKDEVLDDLQLNNLKIVQNKNDYRFSSDSILLSNFIKCGKKDFIVEFCSGCGVISILLNEIYNPKKIIGFEIQKQLCDMSLKSLKYNNITNIDFLNLPLASATSWIGYGKVDVVVCNPPYYPFDETKPINPKYKLTKYEVATNINEIFKTACDILKFGGKFYMVHVPDRLQDILSIANKYNFVCKEIQFVYPNSQKELSHLILMKFTKGGNKGSNILKPIILNNNKNKD